MLTGIRAWHGRCRVYRVVTERELAEGEQNMLVVNTPVSAFRGAEDVIPGGWPSDLAEIGETRRWRRGDLLLQQGSDQS